jgi:hypothetical protein
VLFWYLRISSSARVPGLYLFFSARSCIHTQTEEYGRGVGVERVLITACWVRGLGLGASAAPVLAWLRTACVGRPSSRAGKDSLRSV